MTFTPKIPKKVIVKFIHLPVESLHQKNFNWSFSFWNACLVLIFVFIETFSVVGEQKENTLKEFGFGCFNKCLWEEQCLREIIKKASILIFVVESFLKFQEYCKERGFCWGEFDEMSRGAISRVQYSSWYKIIKWILLLLVCNKLPEKYMCIQL